MIAGDVHVVRHREHGGVIALTDGEFAVLPILVHDAAELDLIGFLDARREPDAAHFEPFVGLFQLPPVHDDLLEDAVIVHYGEAACGIALGRERVHIRRGEPPESAVPEPCVRLEGIQFLDVRAQALDRFRDLIGYAHVEKMVFEGSAQQKLHGHIVDLFRVLFAHPLFEVDARLGEQVAHANASGLIQLRLACLFGLDPEKSREQGNDLTSEFFCRDVECCHNTFFSLVSPTERCLFFAAGRHTPPR